MLEEKSCNLGPWDDNLCSRIPVIEYYLEDTTRISNVIDGYNTGIKNCIIGLNTPEEKFISNSINGISRENSSISWAITNIYRSGYVDEIVSITMERVYKWFKLVKKQLTKDKEPFEYYFQHLDQLKELLEKYKSFPGSSKLIVDEDKKSDIKIWGNNGLKLSEGGCTYCNLGKCWNKTSHLCCICWREKKLWKNSSPCQICGDFDKIEHLYIYQKTRYCFWCLQTSF